jgi:predicted amidohydrolase
MRPPLTIAVAQPLIVSHDVIGNVAAHVEAVYAAYGARLVVFPELSLTGYELDAARLGADDARLRPLASACAETGATALVGAPVGEYVAMLAVDGAGARVVYRKMYLGGNEPARFRTGDKPAVLELDGWRLGLAICKDTGVPQHAADTAAAGMHAYVAGIAEAADAADEVAGRARRVAVTHRVWVAFSSFAGPTGGGFEQTMGRSGIWNSDGELVATAGPDPAGQTHAILR